MQAAAYDYYDTNKYWESSYQWKVCKRSSKDPCHRQMAVHDDNLLPKQAMAEGTGRWMKKKKQHARDAVRRISATDLSDEQEERAGLGADEADR